MNKRITIATGILAWIVTPLLLYEIYYINIMSMLKSFFSFIHLLALICVFILEYNSKHKLQKILVLVAFVDYPLLLTADFTEIFKEKTFIVVLITAWIYTLGFAGWLYTEKQIQ